MEREQYIYEELTHETARTNKIHGITTGPAKQLVLKQSVVTKATTLIKQRLYTTFRRSINQPPQRCTPSFCILLHIRLQLGDLQ